MKILKRLSSFLIVVILVSCVAIIISCNENTRVGPEEAVATSPQAESYLNFPEKLTPTTPYDVDTTLVHKLQAENKFAEAQRVFEILSWKMFLSLNWPLNDNGKPMPEITDTGRRTWETWKESYEIFQDSGQAPLPWGSASDYPKAFKALNAAMHQDVLFRTSKFASLGVTTKPERIEHKGRFLTLNVSQIGRAKADVSRDEVNQAFTSPIYDQNGNVVYYEIRLNRPTVDYIVTNELYNIDGQIQFHNSGKHVSFPASSAAAAGSIELKFAWKIIVPGKDFEERYFTKPAVVMDADSTLHNVTVGLVGMHIGTKTLSSPQWIWATFEQVDNLETDLLTRIHGRQLRPSFYNPDSITKPINVIDSASKSPKTQIQRVLPIAGATQALNRQVQALLRKKNSFWQYYQLIGTQWPTDPSAAPYPLNDSVYTLPDAVANKSGGKPTPTFLTNMVMETYFQGGTIVGKTFDQSTYNKYIANEPATFQIEGSPTNDPVNTNRLIFGTEGCVNCHSSSNIAIGFTVDPNGQKKATPGPARTGDFEWLLALKAQFKIPADSTNTSK